MTRLKGLRLLGTLLLTLPLLATAAVTSDLQKIIRDATFEVVMKKPEGDPVTYEKPLPLELLPYFERHDAYRSIGTAFALGNNTFVTAAHVLIAGVGSQLGAPALRRGDGTVLIIDRIIKFSLHEDFVEFSLREDPGSKGFVPNRDPKIDTPVLAVGNALGEGIVIRDGLFTSETPEDQDGRWKWIRFSAAASPGNSGGPLLDGDGKVLGIVIGKSANENLNYSLPIARLLDDASRAARFEQRGLVRLPFLHGTYTYEYQDQFSLPMSWPAFVDSYQSVLHRHNDEARTGLLKKYAPTLFPKGTGTEDLFFEPEKNAFLPRLIAQQDDERWSAIRPEYRTVELPGDGSVSVATIPGAALLRLSRPAGAADDAFYGDSKAFIDLALKGLSLKRAVGTDQIAVTSLGAALKDSLSTDAFGRRWQQRVWAIPYLDAYLVGFLLPVPDGYAGIVAYAPSQLLGEVTEVTRLLTNQVDVSYRGTLNQWSASLQRRSLLPECLIAAKLDKTAPWSLQTHGLTARIPVAVLSLNAQSPLELVMGFTKSGAGAVWDVQEIWWNKDDREDASVGLWRRTRPPPEARLELRNKFTSMRERRAPYDGTLSRDNVDTYSASDVKSVPGKTAHTIAADLLYGVTVRMTGHPTTADASAALRSVSSEMHVLEPGLGQDVPETAATPSAVDEWFSAYQGEVLAKVAADQRASLPDIRGRTLRDDINDYLADLKREISTRPIDSIDEATWTNIQKEKLQLVQDYWSLYPALTNHRDVWQSFLGRNHFDPATPHTPSVIAAESELRVALRASAPTKAWAELGRRLRQAYIDERRITLKSRNLFPGPYQTRIAPCPSPAPKTSGTGHVKFNGSQRSAEDFWSLASKRRGEEGMVIVSLKISPTGCALAAAIAGSSGFSELDRGVLEWYETLELLPAEADGKPIATTVMLPVDFKLTE